MNARKAFLLALAACAVDSAAAEPAASAIDPCIIPGERVCAPDPRKQVDQTEVDRLEPIRARTEAEQQPPPAPMPPGRGMTWAMERPEVYWQNHAAIWSGMQMFRNATLLDG